MAARRLKSRPEGRKKAFSYSILYAVSGENNDKECETERRDARCADVERQLASVGSRSLDSRITRPLATVVRHVASATRTKAGNQQLAVLQTNDRASLTHQHDSLRLRQQLTDSLLFSQKLFCAKLFPYTGCGAMFIAL